MAPEVFALDDEGKAIIVNATGDPDEVILDAARACPTQAIIITDLAGQQLVP